MINTNIPLSEINKMSTNTLLEQLDIQIIKVNPDSIIGTMPVNHKTHQPMGLLHGGASAALIESLGSIGSSLIVDLKKQAVVGLEINVNHIKGAKEGIVTGEAKIIHCGKTTHIWQVDVKSEKGDLVATGRLTVIVIEKK